MYSCISYTIQLLQELSHKHGKRFEMTSSFLEAFRNVQKVDGLLGACIVSFNFCPCKNEFIHGMFSVAHAYCMSVCLSVMLQYIICVILNRNGLSIDACVQGKT